VRESAVLGLVSAGGIGIALDAAQNFFPRERVGRRVLQSTCFAPDACTTALYRSSSSFANLVNCSGVQS